ncbi:MAG: C25 family cysteine peptidase [Bacteroidia bacterium]|nr:C25 family cysteine peptidase [Bacteroidia bacterium]
MKKFTLLFSLSLIFIALVSATNPKEIKLNANSTGLKVISSNETSLTVSVSLESVKFIDVNSSAGVFAEIISDGLVKPVNYGMPELPMVSRLIELPYGADADITVNNYDEKDYSLQDYGISEKIFPTQPSISKSEDPSHIVFQYNSAFYAIDQFSPNGVATVKSLGIMRGVSIGRLEIMPFRYNPVTNTLKVINNITLTVHFRNGDISTTNQMKEKFYSPFYTNTFKSLINYKPLTTKNLITVAPAKYVIVSDPMFETQLQPFILWKTKKGFNVIAAYTNQPEVGTTSTSIKSYLANLYNSASSSDPAPSFILLVGDVAQIPAFAGTQGSHFTDLYYAEYTSDFFPEVFYGRFSASTAEDLQPQIDKTLEYEQYLMPDPSFLNEVVMIAGVDATNGPLYGNGQINYGTTYYFNSTFGITSHTHLYPNSGNDVAQIISEVSNGCSFANYTAHGSETGWYNPAFSVSDVATLHNIHKYPLMVGNCCLSNTFDYPVCFGEALLRAPNAGAIGYIGASNSSYWDEDYWWGVGARATIVTNPTYSATQLGSYDCMFHANGEPTSSWFITNGQMVQAGDLAVTQANSSLQNYYWEIYHLMGDPSLMTYFSVPPAMTANFYSAVPVGTSSLTVSTEPYAYIAISKDSVLLAAQMTDATGIATLTFSPFNSIGNVLVVVTKQNRQPVFDTLHVITSDLPFVIYNSFSIDDAEGNNNGLADFNEQFKLNVVIGNLGTIDAADVTAVLSTADPDITIINNTLACGNIAGNANLTFNDAYELKVAEYVTDQHQVTFTITITDNASNQWVSYFNFKLNAPVLSVNNVAFNDSVGGNGNHHFDPGESILISNSNLNNGHAISSQAVCTLSTTCPYVTIVEAAYPLGPLGIPSSTLSNYIIIIDPSTPVNTNVDLTFTLAAGSYTAAITLNKKVGLTVEDWETGGFTSYPWQQSGTLPWMVTSDELYEGNYAAHSGAITDDQNSILSITIQANQDDSVSFYRKVSCEQGVSGTPYNWYDNLEFFIDNVSNGKWDGEQDWLKVIYPVTAGSHTLEWVYTKDQSVSAGQDRAWIDFIQFPSAGTSTNNDPVFTSQGDTVACKNNIYTYHITTSDADAGDDLAITCVSKPGWMTTFTDNGDKTAILQGTPSDADLGLSFPVVLSVSDGTAHTPQLYYVKVTSGILVPDISDNISLSIYPNPVKDQAFISINSNKPKDIQISLYDGLGREVYHSSGLVHVSGGNNIVTINTGSFNSGVYYCRVSAANETTGRKLVITR